MPSNAQQSSPGHNVPEGTHRCVMCGARRLDIDRGYAPPCPVATAPCPECGTVKNRHLTTCAKCPTCWAPPGYACRYLDRKRPLWRGRERLTPHPARTLVRNRHDR